ncbi:MAG: transposase [Candidatus Methanomethylophilaceae archaeon]|nr:transposase [Candidatus Methanomethylophilaceae archaeon]
MDGRRVPTEGGYIGSIIDGKYVPDEPVRKTGSTGRADIKYYGRVRLCDILNRDIIDMLMSHYNREESVEIYCMATIRCCYPGTRDYQMKDRYDQSFLSEMYPGVNLGKNHVSREQMNLGMEYSRIRAFMRDRVAKLKDNDTLIIDGCLKQNHSRVDTLSQVSRKTVKREHKDSLMMYAYNSDTREPICSKLYPGNMVDSRAIEDFIRTNRIERGIIVADRGFTLSAIKDAVKDRKDLHYLMPLKSNSDLIDEYGMYDFDSSFFNESPIECKKVCCDGFWMYSFRDMAIAKDEEESYLRTHTAKEDIQALDVLRKEFGTIVFQCDLDAPPSKLYSIYQERWLIEMLFKFYQTELDLDDTRVNSDYSDIGSDFIDFLAALMGSRLLNLFQDTKEMETWTFKMSMDFIERVKMVRIDDSEEWEMNRLPITDAVLLANIGLIDRPIVPVEIKKMGRPVGKKDTKPRKTRSDKGKKHNKGSRHF